MNIKTVTEAQASAILLGHGLQVILWTTCSIDSGQRQAIICDYGHHMAVGVYNGQGDLIERFNVR